MSTATPMNKSFESNVLASNDFLGVSDVVCCALYLVYCLPTQYINMYFTYFYSNPKEYSQEQGCFEVRNFQETLFYSIRTLQPYRKLPKHVPIRNLSATLLKPQLRTQIRYPLNNSIGNPIGNWEVFQEAELTF